MEQKGECQELTFRKLRADEMRVKLVDVDENGATVLLYTTADAVRAILNEELGPFGWTCEHYEVGKAVYCRLGLLSPDGEFVYKDAAGTAESGIETDKTADSDSFKRAARCWGVGEELLSFPKLRLGRDKIVLSSAQDARGRIYYTTGERFTVSEVAYDGAEIIALTLENQSGKKIVWQRKNGN